MDRRSLFTRGAFTPHPSSQGAARFTNAVLRTQDDKPAALKHYAKMRGADLPGWYFLTGDSYDIETIRYRLFNMGHIGVDLDFAMHSGSFRIVNDATNRFVHAQAFASQKSILKH